MNIFIIGASGLVGGNCLKYFSTKKEIKTIGTYRSYKTDNTVYFNTMDLSDTQNYNLDDFKPDLIIHCGALTHVDYCEENEQESFDRTVVSARNVIEICKQYNARLIYTSTDYVFDGQDGPYDEEAPLSPISVYARHKVEVEKNIQAELDNAIIIRITNVYGDEARGKNFIARIVKDILDGKALNLTLPYDQYATPVNAYDIARALYLLIKDDKKGIYNIAGTDYVNRCQLAKIVLKHFPEAKAVINPISTLELKQAAKRPLQGGLRTGKFLSEYPDFHFTNVDDYINRIKAR